MSGLSCRWNGILSRRDMEKDGFGRKENRDEGYLPRQWHRTKAGYNPQGRGREYFKAQHAWDKIGVRGG